MKGKLPSAAQKQLDAIIGELLGYLKDAQEQRTAYSHFQKRGSAVGGPTLQTTPEIKHPSLEVHKKYLEMEAAARAEGVRLRDVKTQFTRGEGGEWSYVTHCVTDDEHEALEEAVKPQVEAIRKRLRDWAAACGPVWRTVSFDAVEGKPYRVFVLLPGNQRVTQEPTADLLDLVKRIAETANEHGLVYDGAVWRVKGEMEDAEGEIDSFIDVAGGQF